MRRLCDGKFTSCSLKYHVWSASVSQLLNLSQRVFLAAVNHKIRSQFFCFGKTDILQIAYDDLAGTAGLARHHGHQTDAAASKNDYRIAYRDLAFFCRIHSGCKGFHHGTRLCTHPFRKLKAQICLERNIFHIASLYWRRCPENDIFAQIVMSGFAEFTFAAGNARLTAHPVTRLQVFYIRTDFYYRTRTLMSQHKWNISVFFYLEGTTASIVEIMHIRTAYSHILQPDQNFVRINRKFYLQLRLDLFFDHRIFHDVKMLFIYDDHLIHFRHKGTFVQILLLCHYFFKAPF